MGFNCIIHRSFWLFIWSYSSYNRWVLCGWNSTMVVVTFFSTFSFDTVVIHFYQVNLKTLKKRLFFPVEGTELYCIINWYWWYRYREAATTAVMMYVQQWQRPKRKGKRKKKEKECVGVSKCCEIIMNQYKNTSLPGISRIHRIIRLFWNGLVHYSLNL